MAKEESDKSFSGFGGLSEFFKELPAKMKDTLGEVLPPKDEEVTEEDFNQRQQTGYRNAIQDFVDRYRDYLDWRHDTDIQTLGQARRNAFQNIMGNANTAGMMYSNFPTRAKYQYDTNTYMPAYTKIQNTYQTGLDSLRSNITNYLNKLADYDAEIASLNKQYTKDGTNVGTILNESGDRGKYNQVQDRTWFYDSKGNPIRFGTTVSRNGTPTTDYISSIANEVLDENAAKWFSEIYKKARSNGYKEIVVNAGDKFSPNSLDFLDQSERDFMDSLGLTFAQ